MNEIKQLWVWPRTHNQTHENHLPKRFGQLKELNNIARESTQNTRDAWNLKHHDASPTKDDCAVIKFSINETNKDLSEYFSGTCRPVLWRACYSHSDDRLRASCCPCSPDAFCRTPTHIADHSN